MSLSRIGILGCVALVGICTFAVAVGLSAGEAPGNLKIVYTTELRGAVEPCG